MKVLRTGRAARARSGGSVAAQLARLRDSGVQSSSPAGSRCVEKRGSCSLARERSGSRPTPLKGWSTSPASRCGRKPEANQPPGNGKGGTFTSRDGSRRAASRTQSEVKSGSESLVAPESEAVSSLYICGLRCGVSGRAVIASAAAWQWHSASGETQHSVAGDETCGSTPRRPAA